MFDPAAEVYRDDAALAAIIAALADHDPGAYGLREEIPRVAREWQAAGFDADAVRQWLDAGVCDVEQAQALTAAGVAPGAVECVGWADDDDIDRALLGALCDVDEDGRHFTARYAADWLAGMEEDGRIRITRPIDAATGIAYSQEHWRVEVLDDPDAT